MPCSFRRKLCVFALLKPLTANSLSTAVMRSTKRLPATMKSRSRTPNARLMKDRAELEALYNKGRGVEEIAAKLNVHRSTVYNELKRGDTGEMDSNGRIGYSAELAQQEIINNYRRRRTARAAAE